MKYAGCAKPLGGGGVVVCELLGVVGGVVAVVGLVVGVVALVGAVVGVVVGVLDTVVDGVLEPPLPAGPTRLTSSA
jgi:hypothetical protein